MLITVAKAILKILETEGIEYAFSVSGTHLLAFLNDLKDSKIKYISVKHETAAGFMALNYTKVAQKPALILATAGPGAANLVNGIAEMYKCGTPGFIITPLVSRKTFGKNSFQDDSGLGSSYSINKIMQNITQKSILAVTASIIPDQIRDLFRNALNPPFGPVHIAIPADLFSQEIEFHDLKPSQYRLVDDERVELEKIIHAANLLKKSKKPLLLIGSRCIYPLCSDELEELIDTFHIPFILTHASKGILNENHMLFGGVLDWVGHRSAEKFIKESDLVLAFGMDFGELETIKYDPELFKNSDLISFDSNDSCIGLNYPIKIGISGDLKTTIRNLHKILKKKKYKSDWDSQTFHNIFKRENHQQYKEMETVTEPLSAAFILNSISNILQSNDSIIFSDIGSIGFSTVRHFSSWKNGYYVSPTGYSMGQGVCGCIGGKLAIPDKNIFCITGDGAFVMHGNEVLTAVQYNLGITWIIFKDWLYNAVEINQCLVYNGELAFCSQVQNPDYNYLAKAYGVHYYEINNSNDIELAVITALTNSKKNESSLIVINYNHIDHLPVKPRMLELLKEYGQTKNIKSNPYLMRALKKVLQEKV